MSFFLSSVQQWVPKEMHSSGQDGCGSPPRITMQQRTPGPPELDLQREPRHRAALCLAECALLSSKARELGQPLH